VKDPPFPRQHPTEAQCATAYSLPPASHATSMSSPATPTPRGPAFTDKEDLALRKSWSHKSKSVEGMNLTVLCETTADTFDSVGGKFALAVVGAPAARRTEMPSACEDEVRHGWELTDQHAHGR